jgi:hypothetical protein
VRFVAEGPDRTRVELEHRNLERHGDGWERMRDGVGAADGWRRGSRHSPGGLPRNVTRCLCERPHDVAAGARYSAAAAACATTLTPAMAGASASTPKAAASLAGSR